MLVRRVLVPSLTNMLAIPLFLRIGMCVANIGFVGTTCLLGMVALVAFAAMSSMCTLLCGGRMPGRSIAWLIQSSVGVTSGALFNLSAFAFHLLCVWYVLVALPVHR